MNQGHRDIFEQWRNTLLNQGMIRQIDNQTAKFVSAQEKISPSEMAWLTALLSRELGRGHICLLLVDSHRQINFSSLTYELNLPESEALTLAIEATDWIEVLESSCVVGIPGDNLPLIFDGERLYFHRYWFYEMSLAAQLTRFGTPMSFKPMEVQKLSQLLNHLFARDYDYIFRALMSLRDSDRQTINGNQKNQALERQRLICESLHVVRQEGIDWGEVDAVLSQAGKASELECLDRLIPEKHCVNDQKVAAAVALSRRFTVISGGPGTGKTTTVAKLLAALVSQENENDSSPIIRLVAPTGKAAARLTESIGSAIDKLPVDPRIKSVIPTNASTLHRLLGSIPNSASFRHCAENKLHLDILVVDEASMVDLPMMYKLFDALPLHTRVILLGDKDQLASVEAGAVLGDICSFLDYGYSREQAHLLSALTGYQLEASRHKVNAPLIADSLCLLQKSYRFNLRSGIGQLAKSVNRGRPDDVVQVWNRNYSDIHILELTGAGYSRLLSCLVTEYRAYLELSHQLGEDLKAGATELLSGKVKQIINAFNRCRLLCALREGEFGVNGLNQRIESVLTKHNLIRPMDDLWYVGRPIMITRNDYGLGLYNGDIGICLPEIVGESATTRLKVFFELPDGNLKGVLPSRIPSHDTAYAMTIHKSQGSEFDTTLMILPPDYSPILTRELIYTGITRAKNVLYVYADSGVFKRAVRVKTERLSGLTARLKSNFI
jgi:exodeoxyribonuclease V alpha subunit